MNVFKMYLQSSNQYEIIENVAGFVGEDDSGKFGIMANHVRMMTCLKYGLSKFVHEDLTEEYIAMPGGIIYFVNNELFVNTRRYYRGKDYNKIADILTNKLRMEENTIATLKESLSRLDENILQRIWELEHKEKT